MIRCPRCDRSNIKAHCHSPMCGWYICHSCPPRVDKFLVFDKNMRFYIGEKG